MRRLRLLFNRRLHSTQRQVETISSQTERQIERHLFRRFVKLYPVRRFVGGWIGLLVIMAAGLVIQNLALSGYFQTLKYVPGGIYNEGVLGRFTNANPLYATSNADTTVSHLIFSGLLKYDNHGKLVGDLASNFKTDDRGIVYTIHLRPNLTWQDGKALTSSDVLFTYNLIQNSDAQSPLQSSWKGIKVTAPDARTIVFTLPGTLASFPYNLTNGIVPEHLLAKVPPADLRSADFNTVHPVGSGPFAWQAIHVSNSSGIDNSQAQIALTPFSHYASGTPKLQQFVVRIYSDQTQLTKAFLSNQLTSVEGLTTTPVQAAHSTSIYQHNLTLRAANMVFFRTKNGVLADKTVRHSLVEGANTKVILSSLGFPARAVTEPLLNGQIGYDSSLAQPKYDLKAGKDALNADGWLPGKNGVRYKDGHPLEFTLTAADTRESHIVASRLQKQWAVLGVKADLDYLDTVDFQNAVTYHTYDAVLDGISIGEDPDVFAYWDSTQADIRSTNRLNLSEYNNPIADASLEAGRSRLNSSTRAVKYKPFLQAWQQDSPALALYQPRLLYLTNGVVSGLSDGPINSANDRFANVQNWEIRQAKITN